jgi:hypothetical protein
MRSGRCHGYDWRQYAGLPKQRLSYPNPIPHFSGFRRDSAQVNHLRSVPT